jgi:hypothetical protein
MSWHYLQGGVEVSSEECSLDGIPFVPSRLNPIAAASCSLGSETESCPHFPFGTMCEPSTETRGEDTLTSSARDSPASHSVSPVSEKDQQTKEICGPTQLELFKRSDPITPSLKTSLDYFRGIMGRTSKKSLATWQKAGSMRNGVCSARPMLALPISEKDCGYWPTIKTSDADRGGRGDLLAAARGKPNKHFTMWPTPQARDHFPPHRPEYIAEKKAQGYGMSNLNDVVAHGGKSILPTPTANRRSGLQSHGKNVVRWQLNPRWVEWLMGWPIGWVSLEPLATGKFRQWLQQHGESCMAEKEASMK